MFGKSLSIIFKKPPVMKNDNCYQDDIVVDALKWFQWVGFLFSFQSTCNCFHSYRNDLPNFEYLTMCLKESLRASSTVSIIQRLIPREITIDDKILPPNTLFTIAINSVHHNPAVWKNPSEYLPERFSRENSTNIDNFSYIPFSAGPR